MTSQRNLNGCWLGFQQSAAVPRVRQVRYQGPMGNCYGLLPLQTSQKHSAPCTRWGRFRACSSRRMERQADELQRAPVEPSSGHRGREWLRARAPESMR